jgi:hypothetical protein
MQTRVVCTPTQARAWNAASLTRNLAPCSRVYACMCVCVYAGQPGAQRQGGGGAVQEAAAGSNARIPGKRPPALRKVHRLAHGLTSAARAASWPNQSRKQEEKDEGSAASWPTQSRKQDAMGVGVWASLLLKAGAHCVLLAALALAFRPLAPCKQDA